MVIASQLARNSKRWDLAHLLYPMVQVIVVKAGNGFKKME